MFPGLGVLSLPNAYIAVQRALGADRLRYICIDELRLTPGDVVLDVGCGPAYYLHKLPPGVKYVAMTLLSAIFSMRGNVSRELASTSAAASSARKRTVRRLILPP